MAQQMGLPEWLTGTPGSGIRTLPQAPTWQNVLAGTLGTGLAGGLQDIKRMESLRPIVGDKAYAYSQLDPKALSQALKPYIEQQQLESWANQTGLGSGVQPDIGLGVQPGKDQVPPGRPTTLEDMSASQLAERMIQAPEGIRKRYEPLLNVKKQEEKIGKQRSSEYEKKMKPAVDSSLKVLTAIDQAKDFVKENPNMFGPFQGRIPNLIADDPSLREERDAVINNLVNLMIASEGAIGRGSNLLIRIKQLSKPAATMKPKEFLSVLNKHAEIYKTPVEEYKDYVRLSQGKKNPEDFLSQLTQRSIDRYEKRGVEATQMLTPQNEEELELLLSDPRNRGKAVEYQGETFILEEE